MSRQRFIQLFSLVVALGGGTYLSAAPVHATSAFACDDAAWSAAIAQASAGCGGGQASVAGHCVGNKVIVDEIYCY